MIALRITNQSTAPVGRKVYYRILTPEGWILTSAGITSGTTLILPKLSLTGLYTVFIDPEFGETLTTDAFVRVDLVGEITPDGSILSWTTTLPGQRVYLDFNASAGANLGFGLTQATAGAPGALYLEIHTNSGAYVSGMGCSINANYGCQTDLANLSGGGYRATITATDDGTMSFTAALTSDTVGVLQRDTPLPLQLLRHGQNGRWTFNGTAGEALLLRFSNPVTSPIGGIATYIVMGPEGSSAYTSSAVSVTLNLPSLPVTGTYTVLVDTDFGETLSAQALLTSPITGNLAVDGAAGSYATSIPGQDVALMFTATEGADLGLGIRSLVTPGTTNDVLFRITKLDGTFVKDVFCNASTGGCQANLSNLQAATYRIQTMWLGETTLSFTATLSSDLTGVLQREIATPLSLPRSGQNGEFTFAGTAGETLKLSVSGQTSNPSGARAYYTVFAPDGLQWASTSTTSSIVLTMPVFQTTGTYTLFVDPRYGETVSAQVAVGTGADIQGSLVVNGATNAYSTSFPAQKVSLTFTATANANLGLGISDLLTPGTTGAATVQVYKPDGVLLSTTNCVASNNGCGVNLLKLVAGTYRAVISPPTTGQKTTSFKTTLSSVVTGTLVRGTAFALSLSRRGQDGRLTYAGTAGQALALQVASQVTVPGNRLTYYRIYKPDGTQLASTSTTSATTYNLPSLPVTGTYVVEVDPRYGETLTAQVTLKNR